VISEPAARPGRESFGRSDAVILAAYLLLASILGFLSVESALATPVWSLAALTALGTAIVLAGPRHPTAGFVGSLVAMSLSFAVGSGAEAALVVVALYRVGIRTGPGRAWPMFAVAAVAGAASALVLAVRVRTGPPILGLAPRADVAAWPTDWLSITVAIVAVGSIAALLGLNAGHRRRQVAALADRAEHLRRERDHEASIAAARERERIAREMHDVIAHSLAVMVALADGAHASVAGRPDESRRAIERVSETGRRTLAEVRRLLTSVREDDRSSPAAAIPRVEAIPALVEEFRSAGLPVRLEQTGTLREDSAVSLTVYRIVQECLTNVLRHAGGVRDVLVRLVFGDRDVTIAVTDVSSPAHPGDGAGRGLVGIRERAAFYDGSVEAGPAAGGGWRVFVRLSTEER